MDEAKDQCDACLAPRSTQSEASDALTSESAEVERLTYALQLTLQNNCLMNELQAAIGRVVAAETLSVMLWLYRRLPRSYGRPPTVEGPILALAEQAGIDVTDCLAERGPASTENN